MTEPEMDEILKRHAAELGEHFEAVQILVSTVDDDGKTTMKRFGSGNFYARKGMCHQFIESDQAQDNAFYLAQKLDPPDDDWKTPA